MRKICYLCDRCGAEIEGNAATIEIRQRDEYGEDSLADLVEVTALFDADEKQTVEEALSPGWDLCADCLAAIIRTMIKAAKPRVKCNLPDVASPKKKGRPRKSVERKLDQMEDERESAD